MRSRGGGTFGEPFQALPEPSRERGGFELGRVLKRGEVPVRNRACVVLMRDDEVCLVRCEIGNDAFHVFPGGGVEAGETPVEAARREALEELGLEVEVGRLFARVDYARGTQLYYLATITGGRFGTGTDNDRTFAPESGERIPLWMPISEAVMSDTRPSRLCKLLAGGVEAFEGVQRIPY